MGNTAVVASGVKNQGDAEASKLYGLVDLKGGGELVELMKLARWTKNYSEVDEKIRKVVKPFLYAEGKGKNITVVELVQRRNKDRCKSGIKASKNKKSAQDQARIDNIMMMEHDEIDGSVKQDHKFRFQCWDLDKRGTVGDTILHLCLLNATQVHADLAKRLLQHFPKMINDIYTGEEYYGETILHIAIVNEDPAMVKFLLDKGADVEARVCGNFFTPDDQRGSRTDSWDHEWVDLCKETNYEGNVYWGDYPLSFAACLDQEECVRLLLAKGADPNKQDTNGNTVMHMLVIYDNITMFDLLHSQGGRLDIKNRMNLTPLTLAAKLARKTMYEHILEKVREVYWLYGNVTSAGYPLTDIDTISRTGEINMDSALHLIVKGEHEGLLEMMDGVIVKLLEEKWKTFVGPRFYRRFILFICYFLAFVTAFALRPGVDLCASLNDTSSLRNCDNQGGNRTANPCYLLVPYRDEDIARMVLEVIVLISAIIYIFLAMKEVYHQGFSIFFSTLRESDDPLSISRREDDDSSDQVEAVDSSDKVEALGNLIQQLIQNFQEGVPADQASRTAKQIGELANMIVTESDTAVSQTEVRDFLNELGADFIAESDGLDIYANPLKFVERILGLSMHLLMKLEGSLIQETTNDEPVSVTYAAISSVANMIHMAADQAAPDQTVVVILMLNEEGNVTAETGAPAKCLFLLSCLFVVAMLPGRAACSHEFEDIIGVMAVLCTSPYFLFFCRGFRIVGPSVVMIYNMIRRDLLQFFIIYVVFIIGFSQAVYIPFRRMDNSFSHPLENILGMFSMSVGDFEDLYGYFSELPSPFQGIIKVIFIVYMIMVTLLLVNMLIAMMGRTYEMVSNTEKEWFRQWANIVLVVEQNVTTENRREQMIKYSVPFGDNERALMIRWHQSEKEREELKNIRTRNKISQRAMASRKKSIHSQDLEENRSDGEEEMTYKRMKVVHDSGKRLYT